MRKRSDLQANLEEARVVRVTGKEVRVETAGDGIVSCTLRGRLRLKKKGFQVVAGDFARVRRPRQEGENWALEDILPRESKLSRYIERDGSERMIVANVERLYVVATLTSPPIFYDFVDRVLVSAEWGGVNAAVVLNKIDLTGGEEIRQFVELYRSCTYPVWCTSALTGDGVDRLSAELGDGVYAFVGASGVGKSSLLMSIDPGLDLKVREVGDKTGRGRHTTTFSQLYRFRRGYLADTPGIQTFSFPGTDETELAACYPEFSPYVDRCRFSPCTHSHEPDCAVKVALEEGKIENSRYESYTNILSEVEARGRR